MCLIYVNKVLASVLCFYESSVKFLGEDFSNTDITNFESQIWIPTVDTVIINVCSFSVN